MPGDLKSRLATTLDAAAIAGIYNQGIENRSATFETRLRSASDIESWFDDLHPIVIVENNGAPAGFAATFVYRPRECYRGIAEVSVYVASESRRCGVGTLALERLIEAAAQAGYWKLLSRVFPENQASRHLLRRLGFREVGVYEKHGKLDGIWKDVIIVELLLPTNL